MVPLLRSPATLERFLTAAESSVLSGSRSVPVRAVRWWRTGVGMLAGEVSRTVPCPLTPSHRSGCLGQSRWLSVDQAPTAMSGAATSSTLALFNDGAVAATSTMALSTMDPPWLLQLLLPLPLPSTVERLLALLHLP